MTKQKPADAVTVAKKIKEAIDEGADRILLSPVYYRKVKKMVKDVTGEKPVADIEIVQGNARVRALQIQKATHIPRDMMVLMSGEVTLINIVKLVEEK